MNDTVRNEALLVTVDESITGVSGVTDVTGVSGVITKSSTGIGTDKDGGNGTNTIINTNMTTTKQYSYYKPAYELVDEGLERSNRLLKPKQ